MALLFFFLNFDYSICNEIENEIWISSYFLTMEEYLVTFSRIHFFGFLAELAYVTFF